MVSTKTPAVSPLASSGPTNALDTLGRHFPPAVCEAYSRFESTRDTADADAVIMAIVLDHIPDKKSRPAGAPADNVSLVNDLGFDSVAITEMVFFLEDLFQMRISNQEIIRVRTVGDLRSFVSRKIAGQSPPNPPAHA
ncbi:MAG: acyl carrier protein [Opitutaceae bacterium]